MNEDFAPFELAVKLREKGFDEPCYGYYHRDGGDDSFEVCGNGDSDFLNSKNQYRVAAPTISQVLKWLREEKKIHIIVEIADSGWYYTLYPNVRWENGQLKSDKYIMSFKSKVSYEQAALVGIEYVLDNLI